MSKTKVSDRERLIAAVNDSGINQRTDTVWTPYHACGTVEGFTNDDASAEEMIEAWAYLICTGQCWTLQGFYGRGAANLIERGLIDRQGQINWELIDEDY